MENPKVNTLLGNMTEAEAQSHVNKALARAKQKTMEQQAQAPDTQVDLGGDLDLPVGVPLNARTQAAVEQLHAEYQTRCQAALDQYNHQVALLLSGFTSHYELEDGQYVLSIDRKMLVKQ